MNSCVIPNKLRLCLGQVGLFFKTIGFFCFLFLSRFITKLIFYFEFRILRVLLVMHLVSSGSSRAAVGQENFFVNHVSSYFWGPIRRYISCVTRG